MRHRVMISLGVLVLIGMLAGCAKFGVTNIVRAKDGELQVRECQMTIWTAIIAEGYRVDDCKDTFVRYEK